MSPDLDKKHLVGQLLNEHPELAPLVFRFEKVITDARAILEDDEYRDFLLDAKARLEELRP